MKAVVRYVVAVALNAWNHFATTVRSGAESPELQPNVFVVHSNLIGAQCSMFGGKHHFIQCNGSRELKSLKLDVPCA